MNRRPTVTIHPGVLEESLRASQAIARDETPPVTFIVFGATGDLAQRKVFPALFNLALDGLLPDRFAVVGMSRSDVPLDEFRAKIGAAVKQHSRRPFDEAVWSKLAAVTTRVSGDLCDPAAYRRLAEAVNAADLDRATEGNRIFYLAIPPGVFDDVLSNLKSAGLAHERTARGPFSRVIVEKPFGEDLASSRRLNDIATTTFAEDQIYRIDHYLGKETVQNLLVLRFANAIFEPIWNRKYVDHVQITAAEQVGLEGRAGYYDESGALRDMVQSHLLQVLALVAMEPPVSASAAAVRDKKAEALRSLRLPTPEEIRRHTLRAQYRGYLAEPGVKPGSRTPTYVALRAFIDDWRWQGVPFFIRTGKCLKRRVTEVAVQFQNVPLSIFAGDGGYRQDVGPNVLAIRIQPDEGIALEFNSKVPGDGMNVANVLMDFRYAEGFDRQPPEAYERLIHDCMEGDATLFARRDAVEASWRFVDPILEEWKREDERARGGLSEYDPGSWGPPSADEWMGKEGRSWRRPNGA